MITRCPLIVGFLVFLCGFVNPPFDGFATIAQGDFRNAVRTEGEILRVMPYGTDFSNVPRLRVFYRYRHDGQTVEMSILTRANEEARRLKAGDTVVVEIAGGSSRLPAVETYFPTIPGSREVRVVLGVLAALCGIALIISVRRQKRIVGLGKEHGQIVAGVVELSPSGWRNPFLMGKSLVLCTNLPGAPQHRVTFVGAPLPCLSPGEAVNLLAVEVPAKDDWACLCVWRARL